MFMVHEQGGIHIPHKADREYQRLKTHSAPSSQLKRPTVAFKAEMMHTADTPDHVTPYKQSDIIT
jgi:hypothetical protein